MKSFEFLSEDNLKSDQGAQSASTGSGNFYTVMQDDRLDSITKQFDTTPDGIAWLNPGLDMTTIKPGTKIRVRGDGKKSSGGGASGNAKIALNYFIQQGWTPEQAAGLVANLQAESGQSLNPNVFGDGGAGYGIAQWHGSRQRDFQRIMGRPLTGSSLEDQLKFVQWELTDPKSTERRSGARLKAAKTAAEAAAIVDQYYERSSGIHRNKRIKLAQNLVPSQLAEPRP